MTTMQKTLKTPTLQADPIEIAVSPPDSLVKFDAPIFVGLEPSSRPATKNQAENTTKLEDMINSVLPPR